MANRFTKGKGLFGALNVGGGADISKIASGSVSLNPGSINATTRGTVTFTLTGADTTDIIVMNPPATLNDDLLFVGAAVTSADTVTVYIYNPTAGSIDDSALTWKYLLVKV